MALFGEIKKGLEGVIEKDSVGIPLVQAIEKGNGPVEGIGVLHVAEGIRYPHLLSVAPQAEVAAFVAKPEIGLPGMGTLAHLDNVAAKAVALPVKAFFVLIQQMALPIQNPGAKAHFFEPHLQQRGLDPEKLLPFNDLDFHLLLPETRRNGVGKIIFKEPVGGEPEPDEVFAEYVDAKGYLVVAIEPQHLRRLFMPANNSARKMLGRQIGMGVVHEQLGKRMNLIKWRKPARMGKW